MSNRFYYSCITALIVSVLTPLLPLSADVPAQLSNYNVVWESPGKGMGDSMPLGNGDIGANAWTEPNGDLVFYISKADAWGDNSRLLKVGRVRVTMNPSPLTAGAGFRQELDLANGQLLVDFKGPNPTSLKLWIDANHPVINLSVISAKPIEVTATSEIWRTEVKPVKVQTASPFLCHPEGLLPMAQPDTVLQNFPGAVGWYHRNLLSHGPAATMKFQGLEDYPGFKDMLLHRTFGAILKGENSEKIGDLSLRSTGKNHKFAVHVLTLHPATEAEWLQSIQASIATMEKIAEQRRYQEHCAWWNSYWQRSWIFVDSQKESAAAPVPSNSHTLKIGVDQSGDNQYSGEMGRVAIYRRALSAAEIESCAAANDTPAAISKEALLYSGTPALHSELKDSARWTETSEFTFEAWVKPAKLPGGGARIIDKITPGDSDGFLLDTAPGNSLRLICGSRILSVKNCLPPDVWSHVAVVISAGEQRIALYLNGKQVAGERLPEPLSDGMVVTRGYTLQRYVDACGSRGLFPVPFNGGIFTVDFNGDPDDRRWGQGYWWQNTRLAYYGMTMSGDFDLLHSLFRMYTDDIFPLCQYRTKKYFGFDGAYFGECIYPWGAIFANCYGWDKPQKEREDPLQRSMWHKWEWVAGPELVFMMMDYCDFTGDEKFRQEKVIPVADAVIAFFEGYYQTNAAGKLVMYPSQACETWIQCTNSMPELAGLHAITKRLLATDVKLTTAAQRTHWQAFLLKLPPLPLRDTPDGGALAPAEKFAKKINIENPELYAVFPFRLIGVGNENLAHGINALNHRWDKGSSGWRQDDIFMAYLGLTDQAKGYLVKRAGAYDKDSRFPAFWGPNYDWTPDQTHGGVLKKALQSMLLQVDPYSQRLYLLPAWPQDWDVDFKLHAPGGTVITGTVKGGRLENLNVTPTYRRKDLVIPEGFSI